jgi:hypothetical protein
LKAPAAQDWQSAGSAGFRKVPDGHAHSPVVSLRAKLAAHAVHSVCEAAPADGENVPVKQKSHTVLPPRRA